MRHKSKTNNSKSHKNRVSGRVICEVVKCSPSLVKMVMTGQRSADTYTGQRIAVAAMLLEEGFENVIINTKKLLNQSI